MHIPGYLTESQQCLSLHLKALSHDMVIVLFGYVLIEIAVGAPPETVRPLGEEEPYSHDTAHLCLNQVSQHAVTDTCARDVLRKRKKEAIAHVHIKRRALCDLWRCRTFRHIFGYFSAREVPQSGREDTTDRI